MCLRALPSTRALLPPLTFARPPSPPSRQVIPKYFYSIYYISPFSWTVRSIVNSEFTSEPYMQTICAPGSLGPFALPDPCLKLKSDVYLDAFGFFKGQQWQWAGIG